MLVILLGVVVGAEGPSWWQRRNVLDLSKDEAVEYTDGIMTAKSTFDAKRTVFQGDHYTVTERQYVDSTNYLKTETVSYLSDIKADLPSGSYLKQHPYLVGRVVKRSAPRRTSGAVGLTPDKASEYEYQEVGLSIDYSADPPQITVDLLRFR